MARYELLMPKMGESVAEATVIRWVKEVGETIEADEPVLEIATDKVDSEVPTPVAGKLIEQLFKENDVVQVGEVVAVLEVEGNGQEDPPAREAADPISEAENGKARKGKEEEENPDAVSAVSSAIPGSEAIPGLDQLEAASKADSGVPSRSESGRFYSPLVRSIAESEGIGLDELENIPGTGAEGRLTKSDLLTYLEQRKTGTASAAMPNAGHPAGGSGVQVSAGPGDEIIEMDRMRRLIAEHMVLSKQVSPHVTSFVEADVTNLVRWRENIKAEFEKQEGEKITYTPVFIEAVTKAIRDYPLVNISVSGTQIIKRKQINIGMATALPSGNLIVPVIRHADQMSLVGLAKAVNDLSRRARENNLQPDEVREGTFTVTNVGTFGNVMGTPIINQPQAAILALGAIRKKPAVLETEEGDVIAIRHMMFLSLSYDHRVIDGVLGGSFLRRIADYLEAFDPARKI
ncbi:MAG: dihydrolipoamide acetyltransferase family protein [Solitalea sp.]